MNVYTRYNSWHDEKHAPIFPMKCFEKHNCHTVRPDDVWPRRLAKAEDEITKGYNHKGVEALDEVLAQVSRATSLTRH